MIFPIKAPSTVQTSSHRCYITRASTQPSTPHTQNPCSYPHQIYYTHHHQKTGLFAHNILQKSPEKTSNTISNMSLHCFTQFFNFSTLMLNDFKTKLPYPLYKGSLDVDRRIYYRMLSSHA